MTDTNTDVSVENHGTVFLFQPMTLAGRDWITDNVDPKATWWAGALVIEHRYAWAMAEGMTEDGLTLT